MTVDYQGTRRAAEGVSVPATCVSAGSPVPETIIDPLAVIAALAPEMIRARLDRLEAEAGALRLLLHAANRRQRREPRRKASEGKVTS